MRCFLTQWAQVVIVTSALGRCLLDKRAVGLKSGKFSVYKCFSSHFPLQKPPGWHHKARMVGRGKLLKETRGERWFNGDCTAKTIHLETRTPVGFLSGRSVGGFQDLPRQFGQVLTSKERNQCNILPVKLYGGSYIGCVACCQSCEFPRHSFRSGIGSPFKDWWQIFLVNGKVKAWRLLQV